ncbi:MAG: anti-sigma factor [Solirubrobacterales bacterium]
MSSDMRESVVEYLLGELTPAEAEQFEGSLKLDPALRAEVERLGPVVSRMDNCGGQVWTPPEPPPLDAVTVFAADLGAAADDRVASARSGLGEMSEVTSGAKALPTDSPPGGQRRSLAGIFGVARPQIAVGVLSALLFLAVGVGVGLQFGDSSSLPGGQPAQTLQLKAFGNEAPADASGKILMTSAGESSGDQMTLDVSGLKQSGVREFYEVWLLGAEGQLVALGSFRVPPDGSSTIELPLPVRPDRYRYFDVSIQSENGDPEHSGRSVLRGLTRS